MRALREVFRAAPWAPAFGRGAAALREALLWAGAIAFLEIWGAFAPHDGADLLGLVCATLLGALIARLATFGWMPATRQVAAAARARAVRFAESLSPRHAVVLRWPERGAPLRPDRAFVAPALVLAVLTAAALAARGATWETLLFVRGHVSYTLYLLGLALVWGVLGGVGLVAILASTGGRDARRRDGGVRSGLRWLVLLVAWAAAVLAVAMVSGAAAVLLVLGLGIVQAAALRRRPPATYHLCRRDGAGALRGLPVHEYLRRFHGLLVLALLFATALGQAHRLFVPRLPGGPLAVTEGLGLLAAAGAVYLAARAGSQLLRTVARPDQMPEAPLVPTLWLPGAGSVPAWAEAATHHGWRVEPTPLPPPDGFDLVVGEPDDPATFHPRDGATDEETAFLLERRFHVVKRRQFWRLFRTLHKEVVSREHEVGSGFLFCPHVWLVHGIVRDADGGKPGERPAGALLAAAGVGRPYAEVFSSRLRRYLGAVLRDLRVDMIFWEDAVTWADLRRVLGVAFEVYDQRRSPLLERHFVGVPRVRVVIQEDDEIATTEAFPGDADTPPALHARVLLILRDRGGDVEEEVSPAPGGHRRPQPQDA
jgi:hypothetical protein